MIKTSTVFCLNCNKEFQKKIKEINRTSKHFCSRNCYFENCREKSKKVCPKCGEAFIHKSNIYCSKHCSTTNNAVFTTPCNRVFSKQNTKGCHLVKILNKNFKSSTQKSIAKSNADCPALYFIKVIFLKDEEYIKFLKLRLSKVLKNTKSRSEQLYKRHQVVDNDLTVDYLYNLWQSQNYRCALTNIPIIFADDDFPYVLRASIDRIDNSKGYIKGNVQFVSLPINYAKNRQSNEDIIKSLNVLKKFL